MSTTGGFDARRSRWTLPPRPEWLARMNEEGAQLDLNRVVPLDPDELVAQAVASTGLSDFGADDWREPYELLVRALDTEAALNLMGRLLTRQELIITLEGRLRIEDAFKVHPEIEDEVIEKPLMIVGQGRTGTTALQNTLAADPNNGAVRHWEAMYPCPPPEADTYDTDPRGDLADEFIGIWKRISPDVESKHHFEGRAPTENIHVHCLAFRSLSWFDAFYGQVPSYQAHLMGTDLADAYRYERRVLQLLQWKNPRRTWVMKSPITLAHLPSFLEAFPDAGFIWPHRDPVKAMSSVVSLVGTLHGMRSDVPFIGDSLAMITKADLAAGMMTQPIGWLEDGTLPKEQLCNVQYDDFVKDTMGVIAKIYTFFDLDMPAASRAAMQTYMDDHPRTGRPGHDYDVGSDDEIALERTLFEQYQTYFDVPSEI